MSNVLKGKINNIDTENRLARVNTKNTNWISVPISIPEHININSLHKETDVAFVVFDDNTGVILCKL